jgi:hypothetical protein
MLLVVLVEVHQELDEPLQVQPTLETVVVGTMQRVQIIPAQVEVGLL